jgi:PIN domain nuclease of toxin-antitoxin system
VNLAEAHGKLVSRSVPEKDAWEGARSLAAEAVDFDREQARWSERWRPKTQALGLSLGDRACLALGMVLKAPVYTADQAWKSLKLGVKIHVVR